MFADYVALYKEITTDNDSKLLQEDLDSILKWSHKWLLNLNPLKYENISISYKRTPVSPTYTLGCKPIAIKPVIRYLGIYIYHHLKWNDHAKHMQQKLYHH